MYCIQVVVEHLRHLDTTVVLSLVKARADYSPSGLTSSTSMTRSSTAQTTINWTKHLENIYSSFKNDSPLPWEGRKHITIMSFAESTKASSGSSTLGPITLRKLTAVSGGSTQFGGINSHSSGIDGGRSLRRGSNTAAMMGVIKEGLTSDS